MTAATANPYLRTTILTASPGELRLMLLDGAIRFAEQARAGLVEKNFEHVYEGTTRCQAILLELINSLRPEHDPELCQRLSGLYTFLYTRLITASSERDPARVDEVLKLLRYERETWSMLLERLSSEKAGGSRAASTPSAHPMPPTTSAAAAPDPTDYVGGTLSVRG